VSTYYNENDPKTAAWLRELIKAGLIADGEVDTRSIVDVRPTDLRGFVQCHFFAGIGGWSYALRLAGWPNEREVWTGSCPCQPWSVAGKGDGEDDARHLWPIWFRLIGQCAPPVVFGEQVASADGRIWLARVHRDMETAAYSFGAANLCAAGVSAPHARQRHFFVADAGRERRQQESGGASGDEGAHGRQPDGDYVAASHGEGDRAWMADADGYHRFWWSGPLQVGWNAIEAEVARGGRQYRAQWRIKPGLSLLADGIPGRVAQLCGFGNAIVPQVAQAFIEAYLDVTPGVEPSA